MIINQVYSNKIDNESLVKLLDRTITSFDLPSGLTILGKYAFRECINLATVNFDNELIAIDNYAFYNCTSLVSIELPSGTATLGTNVFNGCDSLSSINLPGVTFIGGSCFENCVGLLTVNMPSIQTITASSGTGGAFYKCTSLTTVRIGNKINSIGRYAFRGCSNVTKIYIDKPRSYVENMNYYQYAWSSESSSTQTLTTDVIVCNDDPDWIDE